MKRLPIILLVGVVNALAGTMAQAAEPSAGKMEYMENCAVCHGVDGAGSGPYAEMLQGGVMPDLTMLQKGNKGVFPFDRVRMVIDGREDVKLHGPRDMPIWGNVYNREAPAYDYWTTGKLDSKEAEVYVSGRILLLIDYLQGIQQK